MRILALLVFLVLGAGYVWSSVHAVPEETSLTKTAGLSAEQLARAKTLFKAKCARCHGPDGRGQTVMGKMLGAPDFTDKNWWKIHEKENLVEPITNGDGDMPAFGKKLSKAEISLLADYVRRFKRG
jgi:cytochrome c oxidase cbb3-type subunit 3